MRRQSRLFVMLAGFLVTSCGAPPPPAPAATATPAAAAPLAELTRGLASGDVQVIDLTQRLTATTPIIQLPPPFANTPGFKKHEISNYDAKGPAWYWNWIEVGEHVGTHFDAPCHWVTGKGKACVDDLEAKQFVGPAVIIDVTADVAKSADYVLPSQTIVEWEKTNGRIPNGAWVVLRTGWGSRSNDAKSFFNAGPDGAPHYPGFGKEAAEFLTKERDILGVGTEAVGTDAAVGAQADPPFPNHSIMHGAGKLGLTQLANVEQLPATGAVIVAAPLKIEDGSGSPVRVIALVPRR
jgi:kynurenine formamidase